MVVYTSRLLDSEHTRDLGPEKKRHCSGKRPVLFVDEAKHVSTQKLCRPRVPALYSCRSSSSIFLRGRTIPQGRTLHCLSPRSAPP